MRKVWLLGLVMAALWFVGCKHEPEPDPTYTVWTDTDTSDAFQSVFGELKDGFYMRAELTNSLFNEIAPSLPNEDKHTWTENQIYDWFIGRGFGNAEANREKAWLLTINHGLIASRSGNIVYMIIK